MRKVRETYADALGDMINLDFSPTRDAPAKPVPPARSAAADARAARSPNRR
jgi:hypothetical protein